jgi:hypothetical protein
MKFILLKASLKNFKKFCFIAGALLTTLGAQNSHAAKFANQFIEFELPPQWQCNLEGAEWVCQSADPAKKKDAIIVLAAKLKGDQDSLDQYSSYLKAAKSWTSVQGRAVKSEPKYVKNSVINGDNWVDALHMESEIPGFYTRYLATIKQDIGVLVTYSINKAKYQDYLNDFETMVKTLKVFRKPGLNQQIAPQNTNLFANTPPNIDQSAVFPVGSVQGGAENQAQGPKKQDNSMLLIIIGVAVVGYIIWKRKQNSG